MRGIGILTLAAAVSLAACAAQHKVLIAPRLRRDAPRQVAVLLMENDALDLNAPDMLRAMAYERLRAKGYDGPPLKAVDDRLRGIGVSDGGQLKALKTQDIGQAVGADGLLFGEIETFSNTDLGYVMRKEVKVRLSLVDADSGDTLWQDEESVTKLAVRTNTKEAEQAAMISLGERAVSNMLKKPLYDQSVACMDALFSTLPRRPHPPRFLPPPLPPAPPGPPPSPSEAPIPEGVSPATP